MQLTVHDPEKAVLSLLMLTLFSGLVLNIFSVISISVLFTGVLLQGLFASVITQPIFHFFFGMSAYKDVKVRAQWCDLKSQLEFLKDEIGSFNMPSLAYKNDAQANAFAIGGLLSNGLICVNSGLIDKIDAVKKFPKELKDEVRAKLKIEDPSEDQMKAHLLKSVLVHELGHIHHHHGIKKSFVNLSLKSILSIVNLLTLVKFKFVSNCIKYVLSALPVSYYSRKCESQADCFAIKYHYGMGLKFALCEVFHTKDSPLDFHSRDYAEPILDVFRKLNSSHPSTHDRIVNIKDKMSSQKKLAKNMN